MTVDAASAARKQIPFFLSIIISLQQDRARLPLCQIKSILKSNFERVASSHRNKLKGQSFHEVLNKYITFKKTVSTVTNIDKQIFYFNANSLSSDKTKLRANYGKLSFHKECLYLDGYINISSDGKSYHLSSVANCFTGWQANRKNGTYTQATSKRVYVIKERLMPTRGRRVGGGFLGLRRRDVRASERV